MASRSAASRTNSAGQVSGSSGSAGSVVSRGSSGSTRTARSAGKLPGSAGKLPGSAGGTASTAGVTDDGRPVSHSVKGRAPRPSARLNPKTVDPFSNASRQKSAFASVYNSGGVPCRLIHGSVKHKLAWDTSPLDVPFDPVLVTLAEGLRETVHPYTFVARHGFRQLLEHPDAAQKVAPLLVKLVPAIRAALGHGEAIAFEAGLEALGQLSCVSGPVLNPHLKALMVPLAKRMMDRKYKERVTDCLHLLEENGGHDAKRIIKAKIPTYNSVIN